jgi:hypothetical protein
MVEVSQALVLRRGSFTGACLLGLRQAYWHELRFTGRPSFIQQVSL